MINKGIISFFLSIFFCSLAFAEQSQIETIVFVRHGEKPLFDYGQLNCQGLNRSLRLPQVLMGKYGKPDALFAPFPYFQNYFYYTRGVTMIQPLAILLGQPVNNKFLYFEIDKIAAELLQAKYHSSTLFVVWEHYNLVKIAKRIMETLGGNPKTIPNWPQNDYDSIFLFKINWDGNSVMPADARIQVNFVKGKQNLDNQSKNCFIPSYKVKANKDRSLIFVPSAERIRELDQLSCQGLNRALQLPLWLGVYYPHINRVILQSPEKNIFLRSLMTIEPTIITRGGDYIPEGKNETEIIREFTSTVNCCDTIVIAWDIERIGLLAQTIYKAHGGNPNEIENPLTDHDTIYEMTLSTGKKPILIKRSAHLNQPPTACPFST